MVARNDSQFELLRTDMAEMRNEMRAGFAQIRSEMTDMRAEIRDVRRDMFHGAIALFGSQTALFAVLLAHTL